MSSRNLNLHYALSTPNWHIRPDWFAVVGVPRLYEGIQTQNKSVENIA